MQGFALEQLLLICLYLSPLIHVTGNVYIGIKLFGLDILYTKINCVRSYVKLDIMKALFRQYWAIVELSP